MRLPDTQKFTLADLFPIPYGIWLVNIVENGPGDAMNERSVRWGALFVFGGCLEPGRCIDIPCL